MSELPTKCDHGGGFRWLDVDEHGKNYRCSICNEIVTSSAELEAGVAEEKTLPNCGVNFCLGTYKIEVEVNPGRIPSRKLVLEGDATGLYFDKLFDQIRVDVDRLEKMAMDIVVSDWLG